MAAMVVDGEEMFMNRSKEGNKDMDIMDMLHKSKNYSEFVLFIFFIKNLFF